MGAHAMHPAPGVWIFWRTSTSVIHIPMHETIKNLSPKQSFLAGVGAVLVVFFAVGFFVLLFMVLNREPSVSSAGSSAATTGTAQPGQAAPIQLAAVTEDDWVRGNPDAAVTVVEFVDLECPFCQAFHPTMQQVMAEYGDSVRWVYRHFPLTSIHPKAPKEAEAAECAGELAGNEGFWKYVDRVFEVTPANNGLDPAELPNIAEFVGLDRAKFTACLDSGKYAEKVRDHTNQAIAAGGEGTPYSVIITPDGEKIPVSGAVPYEQVKAFLDQIL